MVTVFTVITNDKPWPTSEGSYTTLTRNVANAMGKNVNYKQNGKIITFWHVKLHDIFGFVQMHWNVFISYYIWNVLKSFSLGMQLCHTNEFGTHRNLVRLHSSANMMVMSRRGNVSLDAGPLWGIHPSPMDSPRKRPSNAELSFVVSLRELLNNS